MYPKLKPLVVLIAACLTAGQGIAAPAENALPSGGVINKGAASISTAGSTMTIHQTTNVVDSSWSSFDIGRNAGVNIAQPSNTSTFIGRIGGNNASQIFGSLNANGRVVLTNPRGVVFGPNSKINTGGLVASSKALKGYTADGNSLQFEGAGGSIINQGVIQGDFVALIGAQIQNEGTITASTGDAALLAGDAIEMTIGNSGRLTVEVNADDSLGIIEQSGQISAEGGAAIIKADAAQSLLFDAMNGQSSTELVMRDGKLQLVNVAGTVNAKSVHIDAGGQGAAVVSAQVTAQDTEANTGGQIDVLGGSVTIESTATLDASGENGGGLIQVGGSWQNSNPEIPQSLITTVEQGAQLLANATEQGDGGTVVAWSAVSNPESMTFAHGRFEATGGPLGGHGGQIETSGARVDFSGVGVSTLGPDGAGLWLIDPYDYVIGATEATAIATALGSSNVTISTASDNSGYGSAGDANGNGDITINSPLAISSNKKLTLTAAGDIQIDAAIDTFGGLFFTAGNNMVVNAAITSTSIYWNSSFTANGDPSTNNGNITLTSNGDITFSSGTFRGDCAICPIAVKLELNANRDIVIDSTINTEGGGLAFTAGRDLTVSATGKIQSSTRELYSDYYSTVSFYDGAPTGNNPTREHPQTFNATNNINIYGELYSYVDDLNNNGDASTWASVETVRMKFEAGNDINVGTQLTPATVTIGTWSLLAGNDVNIVSATNVKNPTLGGAYFAGNNLYNISQNNFGSSELYDPWVSTIFSSDTDSDGIGVIKLSTNLTSEWMLQFNSPLKVYGDSKIFGLQNYFLEDIALVSGDLEIANRRMDSSVKDYKGKHPHRFTALDVFFGDVSLNENTLRVGTVDADNLLTYAPSILVLAGASSTATNFSILGGSDSLLVLDNVQSIRNNILAEGPQFLQRLTGYNAGNVDTLLIEAGSVVFNPYVQHLNTQITVTGNSSPYLNFSVNDDLTLKYDGTYEGTAQMGQVTLITGGDFTVIDGGTSGSDLTVNVNRDLLFSPDPVGTSAFTIPSTVNVTDSSLAFMGDADSHVSVTLSGTTTLNNSELHLGRMDVADVGSYSVATLVADSDSELHLASDSGTYSFASSNPNYSGTLFIDDGVLTLDDATKKDFWGMGLSVVHLTNGELDLYGEEITETIQLDNTVARTQSTWLSDFYKTQYRYDFVGASATATNNSALLTSSVVDAGGDGVLDLPGLIVNGTKSLSITTSEVKFADVQLGADASLTIDSGATVLLPNDFSNFATGSSITVDAAQLDLFAHSAGSTSSLSSSNLAAEPSSSNPFLKAISGGVIELNGVDAAIKVLLDHNGYLKNTPANSDVFVNSIYLDSRQSASGYGDIGYLDVAESTSSIKAGFFGSNYGPSHCPSGWTCTSNGEAYWGYGRYGWGWQNTSYITGPAKPYLTKTGDGTLYVPNYTSGSLYKSDGINYNDPYGMGYWIYETNNQKVTTLPGLKLPDFAIGDKAYDGTTTGSVSDISNWGDIYKITNTTSQTTAVVSTGVSIDTSNAVISYASTAAGNGVAINISGLSLTGADADSYILSPVLSVTGNIVPRALDVTGTRQYDGTNTISYSALTLDTTNVFAGDSVSLSSGTAQLTGTDVGTWEISSMGTIALSDSNYTLTGGTTSISITKKPITITGITASDKTYDGGLTATVDTSSASGWISGDQVGLSVTGAFSDAHVGAGKTVTLTSSYSGADAGNYTITDQASTTATITAATLTPTITNVGYSQVYDGDTTADITPTWSFSGLVSGDSAATLTYTSKAYDDAHVAGASAITLSGLSIASITGSNSSAASDYTLASSSASVNATITAATLTPTITNVGYSQVYDGDTTADITPTWSFSGFVSGDTDATLSASSKAYNDKDVADASAITLSGLSIASITGSNSSAASDYTLASSSVSVNATIAKKTITVSGIAAANKTYDGNVVATVDTSSASGWISGDDLGLSVTGAFANKHVGTGKTVTLSSSYSGADAGNYTITDQASTTATITAATVSLSASRAYDGTADLTGDVSITTGVGSETLTYTGATASDAHVATSSKYISALTLADATDGSGGLAANYQLPSLTAAAAGVNTVTITAKTLTAVASVAGKTYDGDDSADVTLSLSGLVGSEDLGQTVTASFDSANAGTRTASIDSFSLDDGTRGVATNYSLASSDITFTSNTANIAQQAQSYVFNGPKSLAAPPAFGVKKASLVTASPLPRTPQTNNLTGLGGGNLPVIGALPEANIQPPSIPMAQLMPLYGRLTSNDAPVVLAVSDKPVITSVTKPAQLPVALPGQPFAVPVADYLKIDRLPPTVSVSFSTPDGELVDWVRFDRESQAFVGDLPLELDKLPKLRVLALDSEFGGAAFTINFEEPVQQEEQVEQVAEVTVQQEEQEVDAPTVVVRTQSVSTAPRVTGAVGVTQLTQAPVVAGQPQLPAPQRPEVAQNSTPEGPSLLTRLRESSFGDDPIERPLQQREAVNEAVTNAAPITVTANNTVKIPGFLSIETVNPPVFSAGSRFTFEVPKGTFTHENSGESLKFRATLADGSPLPSWIVFNAETQTFSGEAPQGEEQELDVVVTAIDSASQEAQVQMRIKID